MPHRDLRMGVEEQFPVSPVHRNSSLKELTPKKLSLDPWMLNLLQVTVSNVINPLVNVQWRWRHQRHMMLTSNYLSLNIVWKKTLIL